MVLTEYLHLPKDYKDEEGLPFRTEEKDLTLRDVMEIFHGLQMSPKRADRLLRILHGRRVAGTLDDPSLAENTAEYSDEEMARALEYLRKTIPVDEILNAGVRAEVELQQLEMDPEQTEPVDEEKKAAEKTAEDERKAIYGESILDRLRAVNIARRELEEQAEAERRRLEEEQAAQNWGGLAEYDPKMHRGLHPKQVAHYEAATSPLEAPPDVPRWRVLAPVMAFYVAGMGVLYLLVSQFGPRPGEEVVGGFKDSRIAVGTLALLNVVTFIAWKRVRLWKFLNKHFILDFVTPRAHQIVTAMFTHIYFRYLLQNTAWLIAGGTLFADEVGPAPFVATYLASGMTGFMVTMFSRVIQGQYSYIMGASSATFGVVAAYFWLYRFDGFKILGLPPDPYQGIQGLGIIGVLMTFFALVPMVRKTSAQISYLGHLVGMLTGIGCASVIEGRWKLAKAEKMLEDAEAEEKKLKVEGEKQEQKKA